LTLIASLVGGLLGYSVAYLGRLIHIMFFDAVLVGLMGGSLVLFYALLRHIKPGRWLLSLCLLLGILGWYGQIYGEYRFTQRAVSRSGGDDAAETLGLEANEEAQARALEGFEKMLEKETGHQGLQGYILFRWQRGLFALGLGPNKSRISMPMGAAATLDFLKIFIAMGLAFLVLRRLVWVKSCPECGRYLESRGEPDDPDLRCPVCVSSEVTSEPEAS
jgi:hypothetical protein